MANTKGQPKKRVERDTAARNWITVLYPESLREDFKERISEWHVPALLSPLHDKDVEKDGKPKKPHYHLLVMYGGNKRYSQMGELFSTLLKAGHVEPKPCQDMRGSARYWCHMDNPEKAQYAPEDVTAFAGANYQEVTELPTDRERFVREMCAWCRSTGCLSFAALMDEAAANHPDWHHTLVSSATMVMFRYIRSLQDEIEQGRQFAGDMRPEANAEPGPVYEVDPLDVAKAEVANAENALLAARERFRSLMYGGKGVASPYLGGKDAD